MALASTDPPPATDGGELARLPAAGFGAHDEIEGAGRNVHGHGNAECIRCGDCIEACRVIFKTRIGETPPLRFGRVRR
jgi:NAD-dependent dihydropyrimidine dehydrogenase PreA subunit